MYILCAIKYHKSTCIFNMIILKFEIEIFTLFKDIYIVLYKFRIFVYTYKMIMEKIIDNERLRFTVYIV